MNTNLQEGSRGSLVSWTPLKPPRLFDTQPPSPFVLRSCVWSSREKRTEISSKHLPKLKHASSRGNPIPSSCTDCDQLTQHTHSLIRPVCNSSQRAGGVKACLEAFMALIPLAEPWSLLLGKRFSPLGPSSFLEPHRPDQA